MSKKDSVRQWLAQWKMMRRCHGNIFVFTLPDGRKMLNYTEFNTNGKKRTARLFEVKCEIDIKTNEPIGWDETTSRNCPGTT